MAVDPNLQHRLRRIVYLNCAKPTFIVGNPDEYQKDISESRRQIHQDIVPGHLIDLFEVLDDADRDPKLPRRSQIFLLLGKIMTDSELPAERKPDITDKVLELAKNDEDVFQFLKYYTQLKFKTKMPSSIQKLVRKFYAKKSPKELADSVAFSNGMYRWAHSDLIKLSHYQPESPLKNLVVLYILTRRAKQNLTDEETEVLYLLLKSDELRKCTETENALPILTSTPLTISQVSSALHNKGVIWNAALKNMSLRETLPHLEKLYKLNLLKSNSQISLHLIDLFTNIGKVKESGVHPIEVFTYMKRLEKGGKPADTQYINYLKNVKKLEEKELKKVTTKNEVKCAHIITAMTKCFEIACYNLTPTNNRFLVSIEVSQEAKKGHCIGSKALTFHEAVAAYSVVLMRLEKDVMLATYKENSIEMLPVDYTISVNELYAEIKKRQEKATLLSAPVHWAHTSKNQVDVFINFVSDDHSHMAFDKTKVEELKSMKFGPIEKYREDMKLPKSKIITFSVLKKGSSLLDSPEHILDIYGFETTACRVVESFATEKFC